jgi:uncharacterized membrane protein YfcA
LIDFNSLPPWQLLVIVPVIAFLYSSVGFGGASGYLAVMSVFIIPTSVMSSTALTLNIFASSIAFIAFYRARHFTPRLLWPFLLTSLPAAFIGGYIQISTNLYLVLLYLSLSYICFRMLFYRKSQDGLGDERRGLPTWAGMIAGAVIGLLSGIIGIGGGIFLAPLIVLAGWGTPKQAAASAAVFIFINSISGLIGRIAGGNLDLGLLGLMLIPVGVLGAYCGSQIGSRYLSSTGMHRALGIILLIAVSRYWLSFINLNYAH